MPGETGATVVTNSCGFLFFPREAAGALKHPAFPTPSLGEGTMDNSGRSCRGNADVCRLPDPVIPGRIKDANPESMVPQQCWHKWIPGLRRTAHPGMTAKPFDR